MNKWLEKLDKTKEGRPYSELTECNIYGDLLERLYEQEDLDNLELRMKSLFDRV